jgi:uncharacterized protein
MRYPRLPESVRIGGIDFNLRMVVVLWVTIIAIMVYHYHGQFLATWLRPIGLGRYGVGAYGEAHHQFALFFIVPVAAVLLMGDAPRDYGLRIGRWKEGLVWLAAVCPIILVALLFLVPGGDLQHSYRYAYYGGARATLLKGNTCPILWRHLTMLYTTGVLLWGWEYLLRGFCLFGLARVLGPGPAIFIQMAPFALLHLGKPEIETMTTWLSGVGFGFVAWRTQSFLYAFLIHWFMLVMTILIAVYA